MATSRLFASLPNLITLGRLVLVPVAIAMIAEQSWQNALIVFLLAGLSDAIDGFLARTFNLHSELGAYLDALADKALLISIYVALAIVGVLPAMIAIIVVSRDLMIMGAVVVSWVMHKPVQIRPLLVSKLNTTAQIVFAGLVLAAKAFGWSLGMWFGGAVVIVAALTVISGAAYLAQWFRHMSA
ncbi:MAG: CDP-alcohol phosphatidyltransferase family protein [Beijerinckiaceae bacterium]|jgi:cardiolipin synthase (CMP-forming)|nr:CDP-alcohol phosphatidyltransferase family protein [Beijerinckiaceae bacterium]MDO9441209.1 CDP-alcohol phosphatidyltransferase family protein [Beijerinckiaceae bacterium]